jgi:hypothetical protein
MQVEPMIGGSGPAILNSVVAGFSFDAEAYAVVEEPGHPKLQVHLAQIRPDLNQAMQGLLKDTPNSQLFTVFGQPEIDLKEVKDDFAWCPRARSPRRRS